MRFLLAFGTSGVLLPFILHSMDISLQKNIENNNSFRLIYAARQGNFAEVQREANLLDTVDYRSSGSTALHWAATGGHEEIVAFLLARNANPDIRNWHGKTPLNFAAGLGHTEIVKLLIKAGADLDIPDEKGDTALHWAIFKKHNSIAKKLVKAGAELNRWNNERISPLNTALIVGNYEAVKFLMEKDAEYSIDKKWRNPFHCAVWGGSSECLEYLFENLSQQEYEQLASSRDEQGEAPIHYAAHAGRADIVELLIKKGALVNQQSYIKKRTPLLSCLRNMQGTITHSDSIEEYFKKENGRLSVKTVFDVIQAFKKSPELDLSLKDQYGLTAYTSIKKTCGLSNTSDLLINELFKK